mmetsp:Transcript_18227/g.25727  ORF Transcript_18227/g.25727 Transcript_18227/m.25727 type:complete len:139 (-) Transcript_18227:2365-2781(-)
MAMEYVVHIWNRLPGRETTMTPIELLSGTKLDPAEVRSLHMFGAPYYALDPTLQDGKKLPRWVPRSRQGQFLGRSRVHASNIGMDRNLRTGNITSQFHVVYDDYFTTIGSKEQNIGLSDTWNHLFQFFQEIAVERERG